MSLDNPEFIGSNVKIQFDAGIDSVKMGIDPIRIKKTIDYLESMGYNVESQAESTSHRGVEPGMNAFRHYLIIRKH